MPGMLLFFLLFCFFKHCRQDFKTGRSLLFLVIRKLASCLSNCHYVHKLRKLQGQKNQTHVRKENYRADVVICKIAKNRCCCVLRFRMLPVVGSKCYSRDQRLRFLRGRKSLENWFVHVQGAKEVSP